jgi:hypothetical protein
MGLSKVYPKFVWKPENIETENKVEKKSKLIIFLKQYLSIWFLLRFTFCLVCFSWFCYNALNIINQYTQYNTIVMLEYELPNETDLPAFTICGNCIIYADLLKDKYKEYKDEESKLSNSSSDDYKKSEIREKYIKNALDDFPAHYIFDNLSIGIESLVKKCYFKPESTKDNQDQDSNPEKIDCKKIAPIIPSIYEGRKCFTYFSQLNTSYPENMKIKMQYEKNPVIHIEITSENRNWPVGKIQSATIIFAGINF